MQLARHVTYMYIIIYVCIYVIYCLLGLPHAHGTATRCGQRVLLDASCSRLVFVHVHALGRGGEGAVAAQRRVPYRVHAAAQWKGPSSPVCVHGGACMWREGA